MNLKQKYKSETGRNWLIDGNGMDTVISEDYVEWLEQPLASMNKFLIIWQYQNNEPLQYFKGVDEESGILNCDYDINGSVTFSDPGKALERSKELENEYDGFFRVMILI